MDFCLSKPQDRWVARGRLFAMHADYEQCEPAVGGRVIIALSHYSRSYREWWSETVPCFRPRYRLACKQWSCGRGGSWGDCCRIGRRGRGRGKKVASGLQSFTDFVRDKLGLTTTVAVAAQRIGALPEIELDKLLAAAHWDNHYATFAYLLDRGRGGSWVSSSRRLNERQGLVGGKRS